MSTCVVTAGCCDRNSHRIVTRPRRPNRGVRCGKPGSETGWWTHTLSEGSGSGYSSGTSWGVPWSYCYDETVLYPGFVDYRYYGQTYGGGSGEEDYIAYVGDAFTDATGPSSDGMFPFAYCHEELPLGAGTGGAQQHNGLLGAHVAVFATGAVESEATSRDRIVPRAAGHSTTDTSTWGGRDTTPAYHDTVLERLRHRLASGCFRTCSQDLADCHTLEEVRRTDRASLQEEAERVTSSQFPDDPEGTWTPEAFFGEGLFGLFPSPLIHQCRFGCGGLAAWRAGCPLFDPKGVNQYHPIFIPRLPGAQTYMRWEEAVKALKALGDEGGLIVAVQYNSGGVPVNYATLLGDNSGSPYWEYANQGWQEFSTGARIIHSRRLPAIPTKFIVVPGRVARFRSPIPGEGFRPFGP